MEECTYSAYLLNLKLLVQKQTKQFITKCLQNKIIITLFKDILKHSLKKLKPRHSTWKIETRLKPLNDTWKER